MRWFVCTYVCVRHDFWHTTMRYVGIYVESPHMGYDTMPHMDDYGTSMVCTRCSAFTLFATVQCRMQYVALSYPSFQNGVSTHPYGALYHSPYGVILCKFLRISLWYVRNHDRQADIYTYIHTDKSPHSAPLLRFPSHHSVAHIDGGIKKIILTSFQCQACVPRLLKGTKCEHFALWCMPQTTTLDWRELQNSQPRTSSLFYFLIYSVNVALQKLWSKSNAHLCVLNSFTSFSTLMGVVIEFTSTSSLVLIMVSSLLLLTCCSLQIIWYAQMYSLAHFEFF